MTELVQDTIKLGLALFLGLIIGYERERNDKPAGWRTVANVCMGACAFAIIGLKLFAMGNDDYSRLLSAPITGIGFLGAGIIMFKKGGFEGVTTSSVLWVSVATGLLCGLGYWQLAFIITFMMMFVLMLKYFKIKIEKINKR